MTWTDYSTIYHRKGSSGPGWMLRFPWRRKSTSERIDILKAARTFIGFRLFKLGPLSTGRSQVV